MVIYCGKDTKISLN